MKLSHIAASMFIISVLLSLATNSHAVTDEHSVIELENKANEYNRLYGVDNALNSSVSRSYSNLKVTQLIRSGKEGRHNPTLRIDNEEIILEFDHFVTPQYGGVIHWIGRVIGDKDSRVRLTIPTEAFFSNKSENLVDVSQFAGSISFQGKSFRMRSIGEKDVHLIYEASIETPKGAIKLDAPSDLKKQEQRIRWLEAQGLRFDKLEKSNPEDYTIGRGGILTSIWGKSAQSLGESKYKNTEDIEPVLDTLGRLLPFIGDEKLEQTTSGESGNRKYYDYRQYLDGIPILDSNVRVFVDKESGNLLGVNSTVYPDLGYSTDPSIDQASAIDLAIAHVKSDPNISDYTPVTLEASLVYLSTKVSSDTPLQLAWSVEMTDGHIGHWVLVDAESGEIIPSKQAVSDDVRVCERNDLNEGSTTTGHPYYTCRFKPQIWKPDGTCGDPRCNQAQYKVPRDVAYQNIDIWKSNIGTNCCISVGVGGLIDIISNSQFSTDWYPVELDSNGVGVGVYVSHTYQIYQSTGITVKNIGLDPAHSANPEVVAHEMGHAIHHAQTPTFILGKQGTAPVNRINNAIKEGIADINALIHENAQHNPPYSSPNWVTSGRDMKVEKLYPDDMWANNPHQSGRIIGHMFYKLVSTANGVNFPAAGKIFHRSLALIQDTDNNKGISFEEFRRAMVQAATTQSQKNAVNEAFQAVGVIYTPPQGGSDSPSGPPNGGSGTASAPGYVNGSVTTACNDFVSYHTNVWGSSSGASIYDVYYSIDSLFYQYAFSTSATSAPTYNTVDVWVKVSSCNGVGCSQLSNDSYFQDYLCN